MVEIKGIYVAMATPFDSKGRIAESVLREWVDFMIDRGVNGLFPVSTTGEYIHLSFEESCQLIDVVTSQNRNRVEVVPGATGTCPENSIRLARHAEKKGCKAVVICPPYLYPMEQSVVLEHYLRVIEAVKCDIVGYNIPQFTNLVNEDTIETLARTGKMCAVKDSSGNMKTLMNYMDRLQRMHMPLPVFTGVDEMLYSVLVSGGAGCMTALAGVVPEIHTAIYRAVQAGDYKEALRLQKDIILLLRAIGSIHFPYGYKLALELRGFPMGGTKQPIPHSEKYRVAKAGAIIESELKRLLGDRMTISRRAYPSWRQA